MRVLVCGGRMYGRAPKGASPGVLERAENERELLEEVLGFALGAWVQLNVERVLIHGAAKGADSLAAAWAEHNGWEPLAFHADWAQYGDQAGPVRNKRMLDVGRPHLVIAFRGGAGTANMMKQARKAGVPVFQVVP